MATKEEVELFLSKFIQKVKVFGIVFRDDRGKNMQTLLELEITPNLYLFSHSRISYHI